MKHPTNIESPSDRELVVTRTFDAPAAIVFEAWTKPELMKRWWVPKSVEMTPVSCEMDVRKGGTYRFVFRHPASDQPFAFFGSYVEVIPNKRLVWTNEESPDGAITTVTFEEKNGKTHLTFHELYPSKEALDAAIESSAAGLPEQFAQLDEMLGAKS